MICSCYISGMLMFYVRLVNVVAEVFSSGHRPSMRFNSPAKGGIQCLNETDGRWQASQWR